MIRFIIKEMLLVFHENQINQYGGLHGIRDERLLESGLAQAEASFLGEFLHENVFEMAAAYGFHLCQNHPFLDGNKRIALIAIYTFLFMNGFQMVSDKKVLYALIMNLAQGKVSKSELQLFLSQHCIPRKS